MAPPSSGVTEGQRTRAAVSSTGSVILPLGLDPEPIDDRRKDPQARRGRSARKSLKAPSSARLFPGEGGVERGLVGELAVGHHEEAARPASGCARRRR